MKETTRINAILRDPVSIFPSLTFADEGERDDGWVPPRSPLSLAVCCLVIAIIIAVLNRVGALFQVPSGVALVFPATAIAMAAGVLFRWWGVLAVFVGYQLLPWGLSTTVQRVVFFAAAASLEAAIPALARLRPEGTTTHRTLRMLLFGAILNTFLSAMVGVPMIVHISILPMTTQEIASALSSWFLGDVLTVCVLGLPVVVLVRPQLFMRQAQVQLFRFWKRRWRLHLLLVLLIVIIAAAVQYIGRSWGVNVHWLATLFITPVLVGAATGGIGGALVTNGAVGIVYIAEVLLLAEAGSIGGLFSAVFSCYMNLGLFTVATVMAGLYAGRSRALLAELMEYRRLLERSFENVVTALAAAIEAKDATTEGHVQRVAQIATQIGKEFGMHGERLDLLRYAAILHDVGKLGVPEDVLNKEGPLTESERELVKRHVTLGIEIVEDIDVLAPAIPFIRYHQERWDGQTDAKYPGYIGLKGEDIPLEARIIAAVDAYDAMTSDRPYRKAFSEDEALAELEAEAGKQFDPTVVTVLIRLIRGEAITGST